jgi:hypothetical protein
MDIVGEWARILRILIIGGGSAACLAFVALAVTQAPLGSPLFFSIIAVPCIVYALLAWRLLNPASNLLPPTSSLLPLALLFAVAFRAPLLVRPVDAKSDMVRYIYDGRLQRLGYNPYLVVPADPAVAATHTDETRQMPSIRVHTPYPAAAQLFFRLVVTIHESSRAMKLALVACDLLTIAVLVAWLRSSNRSPLLALMYAWNPLVILEIAHSGHVDALGALWIAVAAWLLSTGRRMRATIAFVLAVATKLLPIVLLPLFWKRIRVRDAVAGAIVLALLYLPFASAGTLPLGAVPNVVDYIRFNGPLFKLFAWVINPRGAAAIAVLAGLGVAGWMRMRTSADDPAAWGWPMAVSLACAPVVYPWYLLYFTPFLFAQSCVALVAWTFTALPIYLVWDLARHGHRWLVPAAIQGIEYGIVAIAAVGTVGAVRTALARHRD